MPVAQKRQSKSAPNLVAQARGKTRGGGSGNATQNAKARAAWDTFKSILGAIAIYLVIRTLFVEAYRIPSGSMIPTLLVGDWLFVNKLVYGPAIPFTNVHLPGYSDPKRGEVVVFVSPYQADDAARGLDATPTLVKRLVGMPGDTLYMREGMLYLNGVPQPQAFKSTTPVDPGMANDTDPLFTWQSKIALKNTRFGSAPATPTHDNWGPLLIPEKHFFMMGDNRYCSKDSRYWGVVPRDNVRGRPLIVYYSYRPGFRPEEGPPSVCNPDQSDRPLPALTDIRWGRIGHRVR
jgi:signal peptidase I